MAPNSNTDQFRHRRRHAALRTVGGTPAPQTVFPRRAASGSRPLSRRAKAANGRRFAERRRRRPRAAGNPAGELLEDSERRGIRIVFSGKASNDGESWRPDQEGVKRREIGVKELTKTCRNLRKPQVTVIKTLRVLRQAHMSVMKTCRDLRKPRVTVMKAHRNPRRAAMTLTKTLRDLRQAPMPPTATPRKWRYVCDPSGVTRSLAEPRATRTAGGIRRGGRVGADGGRPGAVRCLRAWYQLVAPVVSRADVWRRDRSGRGTASTA